MHIARLRFFFSIGLIVMLTATGCGLTAPSSGGDSPGAGDAAATLPPPPPTSPPASTAIPHLATPGSGGDALANAHDNEESETFDTRTVSGGDDHRINRYERPFTAETMEYLPHVDIVGMSMTQDADWYYVQIKLVGPNPATGELDGQYGVEFDLNEDGKTEALMLATGPIGSQWTTAGVAVYVDLNGDIGGASSAPDDIYSGDGYETKAFDGGEALSLPEGMVADPDLAWVRGNVDSSTVEIGFKKAFQEDYTRWLWNPVASATPLDPTKMYFNDTFTQERAGSPVKGEFYPLKELAGFDNTCRVPANFDANGSEPMGCQVGRPQGDIPYEGGVPQS